MPKNHSEAASRLYQAILNLETEEECAAFFQDICSIKELKDIAQRLEVACMLDEGKNYLEISALTGASTATISRVKKCLYYGCGGYRRALDRADGEGEENQ